MEDPFFNTAISTFLDNLAGGTPTPGGGSAAALAGAMGAGLVSMVCNVTLGKERYAHVESEMRDTLDRSEKLRGELLELARADVEAYNRLTASYRLPRTTDVDVAIRRDAIQASLLRATAVPLRTARAAAEILPLCPIVVERGNQAAVSDAGVGALLAHAAVRSALLSVEINLQLLEDRMYVRQVRAEIARLSDGMEEQAARIAELVASKLPS